MLYPFSFLSPANGGGDISISSIALNSFTSNVSKGGLKGSLAGAEYFELDQAKGCTFSAVVQASSFYYNTTTPNTTVYASFGNNTARSVLVAIGVTPTACNATIQIRNNINAIINCAFGVAGTYNVYQKNYVDLTIEIVGSDIVLRLYLNGSEIGTNTVAIADVPNFALVFGNSGTFYVSSTNASAIQLPYMFYEFDIFDKKLTAPEILSKYNDGQISAELALELACRYSIEEEGNAQIIDQTGNFPNLDYILAVAEDYAVGTQILYTDENETLVNVTERVSKTIGVKTFATGNKHLSLAKNAYLDALAEPVIVLTCTIPSGTNQTIFEWGDVNAVSDGAYMKLRTEDHSTDSTKKGLFLEISDGTNTRNCSFSTDANRLLFVGKEYTIAFGYSIVAGTDTNLFLNVDLRAFNFGSVSPGVVIDTTSVVDLFRVGFGTDLIAYDLKIFDYTELLADTDFRYKLPKQRALTNPERVNYLLNEGLDSAASVDGNANCPNLVLTNYAAADYATGTNTAWVDVIGTPL